MRSKSRAKEQKYREANKENLKNTTAVNLPPAPRGLSTGPTKISVGYCQKMRAEDMNRYVR
jgi:hypothetical protein